MSLILYFHPLSQPSRAVLTFLHLTEIKHELKVIDLMKKEQKSPDFLKISPLGLVPAIDDGGFFLTESEAIIRYLINTRNVGEEWYPRDPKERALVDRYMPFHHSAVRTKLSTYFFAVYAPFFKSTLTIEQTKPGVEEICKKLEEVFLKNTKYVAGDKLTIADFFAVNELSQIYLATDFDFGAFPVVKEYIERCLENPVILELNKPVKEIPEKVKAMAEKAN